MDPSEGSSLGPPPAFGPGSEWPPIASEPAVISERVVSVPMELEPGDPDAAVLEGDSEDRDARAAELVRDLAIGDVETRVPHKTLVRALWVLGPVRLRFSQRWAREDPVTHLGPGTSVEETVSVTLGVDTEQTLDLARTLGMNADLNFRVLQSQLSGDLSRRLSRSISISESTERSRTLRLTNPSGEQPWLFAIWHVVDSLSMAQLSSRPNHRTQIGTASLSRPLATTSSRAIQ